MPVNIWSAHSQFHELTDLHLVTVVPNLKDTVELRLASGTGEPASRTIPVAAPRRQKERQHGLTMDRPDECAAVVPLSGAALHAHSRRQLWKSGAQVGCRSLEGVSRTKIP